MGITEAELLAVSDHRASELFTPLERLAMDFAEAMSSTPADVPAELRDALLSQMSKGQLVELASAVAWENHRARLNRALGVEAMGFSDGAACLLPQR